MDLLGRFLSGQSEFTARVDAITANQWSDGTPNAEWNVSDLVAHLVHEHRWIPPLLHGLDMDAAAKVVDGARSLPVDGGVGADLAEAWNEAAAGSADALSADGALQRTVEISRGSVPATEYVDELVLDLVVHAWDLGRATGYPDALPDELVEDVWATWQDFGDMSASGMFDRPVDVPDGAATVDRLVAMTGRDPQ